LRSARQKYASLEVKTSCMALLRLIITCSMVGSRFNGSRFSGSGFPAAIIEAKSLSHNSHTSTIEAEADSAKAAPAATAGSLSHKKSVAQSRSSRHAFWVAFA
jgi:hypothetical protein